MDSPTHLPSVLIADASWGDLQSLQKHLAQAGVENPLVAFRTGDELLNFLRPWGAPIAKREAVCPCLLFLGLDLPDRGAFAPLLWIRQQKALKDMPAIIIADSFEAKEVTRAAALGVARFVGRHAPTQVFGDIIVGMCRDGALPSPSATPFVHSGTLSL